MIKAEWVNLVQDLRFCVQMCESSIKIGDDEACKKSIEVAKEQCDRKLKENVINIKDLFKQKQNVSLPSRQSTDCPIQVNCKILHF